MATRSDARRVEALERRLREARRLLALMAPHEPRCVQVVARQRLEVVLGEEDGDGA